MCIGGALGVAYVDKEQRNAFMTIAITATGGFFGAEVPGAIKAKLKHDEEKEMRDEDRVEAKEIRDEDREALK